MTKANTNSTKNVGKEENTVMNIDFEKLYRKVSKKEKAFIEQLIADKAASEAKLQELQAQQTQEVSLPTPQQIKTIVSLTAKYKPHSDMRFPETLTRATAHALIARINTLEKEGKLVQRPRKAPEAYQAYYAQVQAQLLKKYNI